MKLKLRQIFRIHTKLTSHKAAVDETVNLDGKITIYIHRV